MTRPSRCNPKGPSGTPAGTPLGPELLIRLRRACIRANVTTVAKDVGLHSSTVYEILKTKRASEPVLARINAYLETQA